ncbi:MAG TPA: phosphodiester glycosidase family protein [Chitinophaga sp.]
MKYKLIYIAVVGAMLLMAVLSFTSANPAADDDAIVSYIADPQKQDIQLYWKDDKGAILQSIQNLKDYLGSKGKKLVFAMNGGMFMTNNAPLGLFIQQKHVVSSLNTASGEGNFYLKPNGVFYITNTNKAVVCTSSDFANNNVKYATQSGPMLVIGGEIHPAFKKGSVNLNIRNGVGILPDNRIVFAMSKKEINFYDFALFFKKLGCKHALYLDGFVSRMYLPEKDQLQTDGNFGVIIGISE